MQSRCKSDGVESRVALFPFPALRGLARCLLRSIAPELIAGFGTPWSLRSSACGRVGLPDPGGSTGTGGLGSIDRGAGFCGSPVPGSLARGLRPWRRRTGWRADLARPQWTASLQDSPRRDQRGSAVDGGVVLSRLVARSAQGRLPHPKRFPSIPADLTAGSRWLPR